MTPSPPLPLDELASDWLRPQGEADFSLPALADEGGAVQAAWDLCGVQNWIAPPTAMATPTALLFARSGGRARRGPRPPAYRWKPYEIERQGGGLHCRLRLLGPRGAVLWRLRAERPASVSILVGGLPRVWRFTDYWNLPPEDVPMLNVRRIEGGLLLEDAKTFGAAAFFMPGRHAVYSDLQAWLDGAAPVERGRVGVAELELGPGEEAAWHAVQGCEALVPLDFDAAWFEAREQWEELWRAAFTPGNTVFSGHLPTLRGELARLYAMSVCTLLMTRRALPPPSPRAGVATGGQCIWSERAQPLERAYVWGGPEGAPTTSFLWELTFQAPLLARLDPAVLRGQLEALMRVDLDRHWGIETASGRGAGMYYGINPGAFLSCASDYVRLTGDREWALRHLEYLRGCARTELTDYGECQNILECVSTYEHQVASFNALQVAGLRFLAELTGERRHADQAAALSRQVLDLYAGGPFACLQPDGSRRVVRTILDFAYVGRCLAADLPADVRRGMVAFFERELQTEDWARALSLEDTDALTRRLPAFQTLRADHQATGAYTAWPAYAASVLVRFGLREQALEWLRRIQELTREGPFGQAYFVHPGGARKASFHNGNCAIGGSGAAFAALLLDDLWRRIRRSSRPSAPVRRERKRSREPSHSRSAVTPFRTAAAKKRPAHRPPPRCGSRSGLARRAADPAP